VHEETVTKNDGSFNRSILVVDDDPLVIKAMRSLLRRAGYDALGCQSGADALELVDPRIAAAIVDIHLPDMNGLALTRKLRETLAQKVPIIILSGDNSIQTIRALPDAGATYFFAKPVNTGMLISRLKEWIAV
jgi:DNA-binding response OmpR family regulator